MWFTLYFSRILLSYAVQVKSRIYFLPVFDMTKKKKKVTLWFPAVDFQKSNLFSWFWLAQRKIGRSLMEGFPFISLNLDAGTIVPTGWLCVCWDTTSKEAPVDLPTWPQTRVLAVTPGKSRGHSVSAGRRVPRERGPPAQQHRHPSIALCFPRTLRHAALHTSCVRARWCPCTGRRLPPAAFLFLIVHIPWSMGL